MSTAVAAAASEARAALEAAHFYSKPAPSDAALVSLKRSGAAAALPLEASSVLSLIDAFASSHERDVEPEGRVLAASMALDTLLPESDAFHRLAGQVRVRSPSSDRAMLTSLRQSLVRHEEFLLSNVDGLENCAERRSQTWAELKEAQKKEVKARAAMLKTRGKVREAETKLAQLQPYLVQFEKDKVSVTGGGGMMDQLRKRAKEAIDKAVVKLKEVEAEIKKYTSHPKAPPEAASADIYIGNVRKQLTKTHAMHGRRYSGVDSIVDKLRRTLDRETVVVHTKTAEMTKQLDETSKLYATQKAASDKAHEEERVAIKNMDAAEKDCKGVLLQISARRSRTKLELWAVDFALQLVDTPTPKAPTQL